MNTSPSEPSTSADACRTSPLKDEGEIRWQFREIGPDGNGPWVECSPDQAAAFRSIDHRGRRRVRPLPGTERPSPRTALPTDPAKLQAIARGVAERLESEICRSHNNELLIDALSLVYEVALPGPSAVTNGASLALQADRAMMDAVQWAFEATARACERGSTLTAAQMAARIRSLGTAYLAHPERIEAAISVHVERDRLSGSLGLAGSAFTDQ